MISYRLQITAANPTVCGVVTGHNDKATLAGLVVHVDEWRGELVTRFEKVAERAGLKLTDEWVSSGGNIYRTYSEH